MSTHEEIIDNLPSMDDFEEGSSLLIDEEIDESGSSEDPPEGETTEEREAREQQEGADAEEAERQEALDKQAEEDAQAEKDKAAAKKAEEDKANKSKDGDADDDDDDEAGTGADNFYQTVTGLHGIELEVDYGDVDPLTPEGVALREQNLAEAAIASQMEYLSKTYPKEYRVLEHAVNGGSVDDLFKPGYLDYSKIELKEDDPDQHKKILKDYYLDTGISEKKADLLVEADEDSEGGTFAAAQEALKDRKKQQDDREAEVIKKQKAEADRVEAQNTKMRETVSEITTSGKVGNFQIPKADQEKFYEYALSNIRRAGDGTYSFVVPLGPESVGDVLQQAYFSYKKGDLSKLVDIKATTKAAQRLKTKVKTQGKKLKSSEASVKKQTDTKLDTFDAFTVD
jgi:hypothetical protein